VPNVSRTDGSKLGPLGQRAGISDVISGNNSVIDPSTGQVLVPGFTAGPGFDVASGWGTINASVFVPALVLTTEVAGEDGVIRAQAAAELSRLEHSIRLSPRNIGPGGTSTVTGSGFLPGHPVELTIDGTLVTTLTASSAGTVSYPLSPSALGLSAGHHVLRLQSMLITTTANFTSR